MKAINSPRYALITGAAGGVGRVLDGGISGCLLDPD